MKLLFTLLVCLSSVVVAPAQFSFDSKKDAGQVTTWDQPSVKLVAGKYHNRDGKELHDWRNAVTIINTPSVTIDGNYFAATKYSHLEIRNCQNVLVENNFFANGGTSVKIVDCKNVVIRNNKFLNAHGNPAEAVKGGNFIQIAGRSSAVEIYKNNFFAAISEANTEDLISIVGSGVSGVEIYNNILYGQGGNSGGAVSIQMGDGGGSNIYAHHNLVIDPAGAGLSISGGQNNRIENNSVIARNSPVATTGIYIANYSPGSCANNTISNNIVRVVRRSGGLSQSFSFNNKGDCGFVAGLSTNNWNAKEKMFPIFSIPELLDIDEDKMWQIRKESMLYAGLYNIQRPIANAGLNQIASPTYTVLSGSGGHRYQWTQIAGIKVNIAAPLNATTFITGLLPGEYIFRLVVTDSNGEEDADWVTVTVK